jgi:hypothetical protein
MPDNLRSNPTINEQGRIVRASGEDFGPNLRDAVTLRTTATPDTAVSVEVPSSTTEQPASTTRLWPTPAAKERHALPGDAENFNPATQRFYRPTGHDFGITLGMAVKMWPTPKAQETWAGVRGPNAQGGPGLTERVGGQLNPTWVEWLMGFPLRWTDLEPSETP